MRLEVQATGLRAYRERRGLTQRELAQAIGVSQNYIPALESGVRRPGPRLRQLLMQFFGCHFEDLFRVVMVSADGNIEQVLAPQQQKRVG